jgi:hypothetical protein
MKITDVKVLEEAFEDLEAGRDFYEERAQGVGAYFAASLVGDIRSLRLYAGIHPVHFGYMRMLASRFPFAIYYEIVDGVARVAAILDMRRDPAAIRKRLAQKLKP